MRRLSGFVAALVLTALCAPLASAQDFPTRPIRVVVAFPAGGPTDLVARLLGDKLRGILGQNIVVENKSGANGTLGADFVAKSEPDGHTLFMTTVGAVTVSPHIWPNLPYQPLRDFAPVIHIVRNTTIVVAHPGSGIKTVKDLVDRARAKPNEVPFASTGIGGTPHLAFELLQQAAGIKLVHVPYRGAAPAITDVLSGQVPTVGLDVPVVISHIKGGKLIPIGSAADQRSEALPDVPTLAEQGYPNTDSSNWYGLLAPAKTPPAVIAKLNAAFNAALKDPEIRAKLIALGATPTGGSAAEFGVYFKAEYEKWGKLVRERGIKE